MTIKAEIETKLSHSLSPTYLSVENESHGHNVAPGSETHFKVIIVSQRFSGLTSVRRHQQIYTLLADELQGPVHALSLHTYTDDEWQNTPDINSSPNCLGKAKPV